MFLLISCGSFSLDENKITEKELSNSIESSSPIDDMGISNGSYHGISFGTSEYALNKSNGKYVIFRVKNTGKVNVKISVNNYSKELTLEPDEEGCISEEFSGDEQDFTFKAVPTPNGGDISIDYKIKQSNTKE